MEKYDTLRIMDPSKLHSWSVDELAYEYAKLGAIKAQTKETAHHLYEEMARRLPTHMVTERIMKMRQAIKIVGGVTA